MPTGERISFAVKVFGLYSGFVSVKEETILFAHTNREEKVYEKRRRRVPAGKNTKLHRTWTRKDQKKREVGGW